MPRSEETAGAIERFVDRQVDEPLARRIDQTVNDEALVKVVNFVEERFQKLVNDDEFENKVSEFLSRRLDDLAEQQRDPRRYFYP